LRASKVLRSANEAWPASEISASIDRWNGGRASDRFPLSELAQARISLAIASGEAWAHITGLEMAELESRIVEITCGRGPAPGSLEARLREWLGVGA
jgi:hypothetical protein